MARSCVALVACASTVCTMLAAVALVVPSSRPPPAQAASASASAAAAAAVPLWVRQGAHRPRRRLNRQGAADSARLNELSRKLKAHTAAASATGSHGPPPAGIAVTYTAAEGYRSQDGQDKWVDRHIFHGRRGGVFVDLGCYDGVTYSNTWYFEKQLGWSGVCVEPNPGVFPRIADQAGRTSGVQVAVSDHDGSAMFVAAYMRSSLNESAVDYEFLAQQGVSADRVATKVVTPARLLADHLPKVSNIDYVNIDVESQARARPPFGSCGACQPHTDARVGASTRLGGLLTRPRVCAPVLPAAGARHLARVAV